MIDQLNKITEERGGRLLSTYYANSKEKVLLECAIGHQWEVLPSSLKRGSWCPYCARKVKLTIEEMHQIARDRGGKCLSDTYKNTHSNLLWECGKGHQWQASPVNIRVRGRWCPTCSGIVKWSIEDMKSLAIERGGKCLSDTYNNNESKLLWECSEGHRWEAIPRSVLSGSWCRKCYFSKRFQKKKIT
jgi:hypothetical protein